MKINKKNKKFSNIDPVRIIFTNIYTKYKTNVSNYNIGQINSILFNYSIPNSTRILSSFYKEMIITCDNGEYIKYKYNINESTEKLKLYGYIYINNFKPPPNYLGLDKINLDIMRKLLIQKQDLIDRYNFYMIQKKNENISKDDNINFIKDNFIDIRNIYDSSSLDKRNDINNINTKVNSAKNKPKPILSINKTKEKEKGKKTAHFLRNEQNDTNNNNYTLKSYLSSLDEESKFVSKNMEPNAPEMKENEENKENSIDSIMNLMENFKSTDKDGDNNDKNIIYRKEYHSILNPKNNNKRKKAIISTRHQKRTLTNQLLFNKNNIYNMINNYKKNTFRMNKYYLSIEKFRERLHENEKIKKYLENYWKTNKNLIKNLIDSIKVYKSHYHHNDIMMNNVSSTNYSSKLDYTLEVSLSISKNKNYNYFNDILSFNSKSKLTLSPNLKQLMNQNSYKSIPFKKYKLNINKNKFINSAEMETSKNPIIMKIRKNSDFMKNKNFTCIFKKLNNVKYKKSSKTNNETNKNKIVTLLPLSKIKKNNLLNNRYNIQSSFNLSNNFKSLRSSSVSNRNKLFKRNNI